VKVYGYGGVKPGGDASLIGHRPQPEFLNRPSSTLQKNTTQSPFCR
jgi:hypothetical protein